MPSVCSCGATLPEDARFCHRCGKPQREEFTDVEPVRAPEPVVTSARNAPREQSATFGNPLALRTSLLVASIATILEITPFAAILAPVMGGFAAALLYKVRSGQALTPRMGAKLGWMTAVLNAVLLTVYVSFRFAVAGASLFDPLRESFRLQAKSAAQMQALEMMNDPRFLAFLVLMMWIMMFGLASLLYMAGGALAARVYREKTS